MKNRFGFAIALAGALLCALPLRLPAQESSAAAGMIDLASGPVTVGMGDQALVCATNLGSVPVSPATVASSLSQRSRRPPARYSAPIRQNLAERHNRGRSGYVEQRQP